MRGMHGPSNYSAGRPPLVPPHAERNFNHGCGQFGQDNASPSRINASVRTTYPEEREQSLYHEGRGPTRADMSSILAPGAPIEVWRASDKVWHPATIATPDILRGTSPPAPGAVLCVYEGSKLQKWVRAEDSLTLIRPRWTPQQAHLGVGCGDGQSAGYREPQTRVPPEYAGAGYIVPQTRVPPGYG